jgi:hypothetical protein
MELYARYAWAIDSGDPDAYAGNFIEGGNLFNFTGHEEIKAYLRNFVETDTAYPGAQHLVSQFVIEGNTEEAHARAYVIRCNRVPTTTNNQIIFSGFYNDVVVKVDGKWFFKKKTGHVPEELLKKEYNVIPDQEVRRTIPLLWDNGAPRGNATDPVAVSPSAHPRGN